MRSAKKRNVSISVLLGVAIVLSGVSGITNVACAASLNAASMIFRSDGSVHDTTGWCLSSNCYIGTFITTTGAGSVTFTVRAEGQSAAGVLPQMHLHVGDFNTAWNVADHGGSHTTYSDYTTAFNLPAAGTYWVRIEFTNDYNDGLSDRNLYAKSLTVTGTTVSLANTATNANCLAAADTYIANFRRGSATVTLTDPQGQPLPQGISVRAKRNRHSFNWGACGWSAHNNGDLAHWNPNPPLGSNDNKNQQFMKDHFNMVAIPSQWGWFNELTPGIVDMECVDAALAWCNTNGLRASLVHVFFPVNTPGWANDLREQAIAGNQTAKQQLREAMSDRIQYYVGDRANLFSETNTFNEDYHYNYFDAVFSRQEIADIYNEVRTVSGGRVKSGINDWAVVTGNPAYSEYSNWYRDYIYSIVNAGGQIDCIGLQAHTTLSEYMGSYSPVHIFRNLQMLSGFDRPITFTEFSLVDNMNNPAMAPQVLNNYMRLIFGNDNGSGFVMWGFWKGAMWADHGACALAEVDWSPTASGQMYDQLMDQWNTDITTTTNGNGRITFTGYYGDYELTAGETLKASLTLQKGVSNYTAAAEPFCSNPMSADLDGNCEVDVEDLVIFCQHWLMLQ